MTTMGGRFTRRAERIPDLSRLAGRPALPLVVLTLLASGCNPSARFKLIELSRQQNADGCLITYDTNGDRKADYWQRLDRTGRVVALQFDDTHDEKPDETVDLDRLPAENLPHVIIILDGCPFECVEEAYRNGSFRAFYPPARMISCFPANSDPAISQIWHCGPTRSCEALYYDRAKARLNDGNASYLKAENSPWTKLMAYRCSFWWDANAYLTPQTVFDHELRGMYRTFSTVREGTSAGYSVGTAGLGTRGAKPAMLDYLRRMDRFTQQLLYERRGRIKMSLTADHGQGMKRCTRLTFKSFLAEHGFNLGKSIRSERDAVAIEYGLVTYAAFFANNPDGLAKALREHPAVDLVFYRSGGQVIVLSPKASAAIEHVGDGFIYDMTNGDPLQIAPIVQDLRQKGKVSPDRAIDDRSLFEATATHIYPDAVRRAWQAFNGLMRVPPDVLVSLKEGHSHGSAFFDFMIHGAASTHGSIDRLSSTSFLMTMKTKLPPALRLEDALPALSVDQPTSTTRAQGTPRRAKPESN